MTRGCDRKRDRCKDENDRRNGRGLGKNGSRAPWSESSLAAHASKGGGHVPALAALQQHNNDQEKANDYVNDGDQYDHEDFRYLSNINFSRIWCDGASSGAEGGI